MGRIYTVGCRDCKVTRDLDKFRTLRTIKDRKDALDLADEIQQSGSFRAALLCSFLWEHRGHNCTVFAENDAAEAEFDCDNNDSSFWDS